MSRYKVLKIGLGIVVGIIAVRLFWIQIIQHDEWLAKAEAQQTLQSILPAQRGEIYMMDGSQPVVVAMNEKIWTVIVDPAITDKDAAKNIVEQHAHNEVIADWDEAFADKSKRYYVVARNVSRTAAEAIANAKVKGVVLQENTRRAYPENSLGASVLGFVNAEGVGQYGVEGTFNNELKGTNGLLKTVTDINKVALSIGDNNVRLPAKNGKNIVLTIDRNLQYKVEQILEQQMKAMGKTHASALVMNPKNGKVLAMANLPSYNPAEYNKVTDASVFTNGILDDPYEPASVCKTFALASSIDQGKMNKDSTYINTGSVTIDGWEIKNAEQRSYLLGRQNMQTVLNYSLNTGSIQSLRWLGGSEEEITDQGRELLYDYYYNHFGLGQATGIELTEALGQITKPYEGYGLASTYANMTFGQNLQFTMIQVAAAFSSVVNGGQYYTPTVIAGEMQDGNFVENQTKPAVRRTISEDTSNQMRELLYGTRHAWRDSGADPAGYYVGGKTGTAQVIRDGAYVLDETRATYIGFGGTEGELPEYVIMVRIWKDGTTTDGQNNALPVFNALKSYVQDYLRVKPKGA